MTVKDFNAVIDYTCKDLRQRLESKNIEYVRGGDKLYNFKRAAAVIQKTPEMVLWGMFLKHFISVQDIVEDVETGKVPPIELVKEKIGDSIAYLTLLLGMITERVNE